MTLFQVRNRIRDGIFAEMQTVSDAITSGKATDFAEYKRMVGALVGMKKSLDVVDAVFNRLDDEGE